MKALREIGIKKAFKFGFVTILMVFYKAMIFPQLRVLYLRMLGAKIGKNVIIHNVNFFTPAVDVACSVVSEGLVTPPSHACLI